MTEVREITRRSGDFENCAISSSVISSANGSCAESPERFSRGNTASERTCKVSLPVITLQIWGHFTTAESASTAARPARRVFLPMRKERGFGEGGSLISGLSGGVSSGEG